MTMNSIIGAFKIIAEEAMMGSFSAIWNIAKGRVLDSLSEEEEDDEEDD